MTKQAKVAFISLFVLAILYFVNSKMQDKYTARDTDLFTKNREHVTRIQIQKDGEEIELVKVDTSWTISGQDSLSVKTNVMNTFFDDIESLEREESPISTNPKNWSKYSVDDSTGTHLSLFGLNDKELGRFVLGRSKTNYSQNSIRIDDNPDVYLTSKNVLHRIQTRPTFWGEIPKPPVDEVPEDTTFKAPEIPTITIPPPPDTTGS